MKEFTVILTSCDRPDLLKRTLDSFFKLGFYNIKEFHIHNDGTDDLFTELMDEYPHITWHFSGKRIGLSKSLDYLMKFVDTEYYFSCEDDWSFSNNQHFIDQSIILLENYPAINQVWIRDEHDHSHPLELRHTMSAIRVRDVTKNYQNQWGGFTFNPSMRRLSDYNKYFPNGYAEYGDEADCSRHVELMGYSAVSLCDYACRHIGDNRHTEGFKV